MAAAVRLIVEQLGYAGVFLLTFAETVFPPLPSEIIIPLAGLEARHGALALPGVILAGTAGTMLGNFFWYWLAFRFGQARLRRLVENHGRWLTLDWDDILRGEGYFMRYGAAFVAIGRMLPAIRTFVSFPAGWARMPVGAYLAWSTLGTVLWTGALAYAGWRLGERYDQVAQTLAPLTAILLVLLCGWYVWRLLRPKA